MIIGWALSPLAEQGGQDAAKTSGLGLGCTLYGLGNRQWAPPSLRQLLEEILPQNSAFVDPKVALSCSTPAASWERQARPS